MEDKENNKQIIVHKSNWSSQIIYTVIGLIIVFSFYKNNPDEGVFARAVVKEFSRKKGLNNAMANVISKAISHFGGDLLKLPIERNNYIFFSTFSFSADTINAEAFGLLGNVYFTDFKLASTEFNDSNLKSELRKSEEEITDLSIVKNNHIETEKSTISNSLDNQKKSKPRDFWYYCFVERKDTQAALSVTSPYPTIINTADAGNNRTVSYDQELKIVNASENLIYFCFGVTIGDYTTTQGWYFLRPNSSELTLKIPHYGVNDHFPYIYFYALKYNKKIENVGRIEGGSKSLCIDNKNGFLYKNNECPSHQTANFNIINLQDRVTYYYIRE